MTNLEHTLLLNLFSKLIMDMDSKLQDFRRQHGKNQDYQKMLYEREKMVEQVREVRRGYEDMLAQNSKMMLTNINLVESLKLHFGSWEIAGAGERLVGALKEAKNQYDNTVKELVNDKDQELS